MTLYHGSNLKIQEPMILDSYRALDFGSGFYTTTNIEQAISFAKKVYERKKFGKPIINFYESDELLILSKKYNILIFTSPNENWLDFVYKNRKKKEIKEEYDGVYGPVANDTIFETFTAYEEGILTKEETIKRLMIKNLYNQFVFSSKRIINELHFIKSMEV